jgi:glycosyltransferase involved in cell wall biosynthesis
MNKLPITVIVHTLNEEKNIKNCLESVIWADEILLIDNYSDDSTVEIAKHYTDNIIFCKRMGYSEPARKFAVEKATNEWILILDADEMVPLKMKNHLEKILNEDLADVVSIPHNNYFFGYLMQYTGWGALQDMHNRFYKKSFVEISRKIHSHPIISKDARILTINDPDEGFVHFNYIDVEHFIKKMNRYTTIEAKALFEAGEDLNSRQLVLRIFDEFKLRYLSFRGYKDGFNGLSMSLMMAMYRLTVYMKLKLMQNFKSYEPREEVVKKYQKIADEIIDEYKK